MNNENWILCRKPLQEKTIADNVLKYGVGGINIDGSRIGFEDTKNAATNPKYRKENGYKLPEKGQVSNGIVNFTSSKNEINTEGRFPANFIYCSDDDVLEEFNKAGFSKRSNFRGPTPRKKGGTGNSWSLSGEKNAPSSFGDEGTPSRFFFDTKE